MTRQADICSGHSAEVGRSGDMGKRISNFLVLLLFVGAILLLAQTSGVLDLGQFRDLVRWLPFGQTSEVAVQPTPRPTTEVRLSPTATARPLPTPTPVTAAEGQSCTATAPRFVHGVGTLKAALGTAMGQPLECERVVDAEGDSEQRTTTGLAYYSSASNIAGFTNGWDHWALTAEGVVHWTGDESAPPPGAEPFR